MTTPLLSIHDLTVEFGGRAGSFRAVDELSLDVQSGECIGIVGESGSGKSTASLALLRLIAEPAGRIVGGRIELEGRDLLALSTDEMRAVRGKEISMIFQEPMTALNPLMTVGAQIDEILMLHEPLNASARRRRTIEMLKLVGISRPEERLASYPHEFSGGMRQRVMIAMALACNPKVVVADEPTTALDVTIQAQVLDLLRELRSKLQTAIILITHDLGVISEIADRVLVMYCGRVVESAPTAQLFSAPAHPYTEGLLRSIPDSDIAGDRLYQIPGSVPPPNERGPGCAFYDRCPRHMPVCLTAKPPLFPVGPNQFAACYAAEKEAAE